MAVCPFQHGWGWRVAAVVLAAGGPLFVCMPPWTDVTLYDLAARNVLRGGVHYRDVFDTNFPGMVWCLALLRGLVGSSSEWLRLADLAVIGGASAVLAVGLKRGGVPPSRLGWFVAACALFYLFLSEFNHVQRDGWMLLPALLAAEVRQRRWRLRCDPSGRCSVRRCWLAVGEGMLWGAGVWLKPHVSIPALAVLGAGSVLLYRRGGWRLLAGDAAAVLAGGFLCGAAGIVWLMAAGAWPYFLDIMIRWVPGYLSYWPEGLAFRAGYLFRCFGPWSALHALALPIAAYWLYRLIAIRALPGTSLAPGSSTSMKRLSDDSGDQGEGPIGITLLAALYVGWLLQVVVVQKPFDYAHVPPVFLALALLTVGGWNASKLLVLGVLAGSLLLQVPPVSAAWQRMQQFPLLERWTAHPLLDRERTGLWFRCWTEGSTPELRNRLGLYVHCPCATNWEELVQIADYLRHVRPPLQDGELNCWHDGTHPLYLLLDLEPATRYLHYGTAFSIRARVAEIAEAVVSSRQRYVVSDLFPVLGKPADPPFSAAPGQALRLPPDFPEPYRQLFPWNQPLVFRCGRYCVHKVDGPLGVIDIHP
ncbi:MAG: hypothetical protein N3E46_06240 [Gemmataceae bacterium]|nr:hypothetical protein [Gemmataceae bacterium]